MKMDFWRAAGVTAGVGVASEIIWVMTFPLSAVSMPVFLAKDILLTVALSAFFAWIYFEKATPSVRHGFCLGVFMVAVPFVISCVLGLVYAAAGIPLAPMYPVSLPEWYALFNLSLAVPVVLSAGVTGWYLAKKK